MYVQGIDIYKHAISRNFIISKKACYPVLKLGVALAAAAAVLVVEDVGDQVPDVLHHLRGGPGLGAEQPRLPVAGPIPSHRRSHARPQAPRHRDRPTCPIEDGARLDCRGLDSPLSDETAAAGDVRASSKT